MAAKAYEVRSMIRNDWMFAVGAIVLSFVAGAFFWAGLVAYTRIAYASLGLPSPL